MAPAASSYVQPPRDCDNYVAKTRRLNREICGASAAYLNAPRLKSPTVIMFALLQKALVGASMCNGAHGSQHIPYTSHERQLYLVHTPAQITSHVRPQVTKSMICDKQHDLHHCSGLVEELHHRCKNQIKRIAARAAKKQFRTSAGLAGTGGFGLCVTDACAAAAAAAAAVEPPTN